MTIPPGRLHIPFGRYCLTIYKFGVWGIMLTRRDPDGWDREIFHLPRDKS